VPLSLSPSTERLLKESPRNEIDEKTMKDLSSRPLLRPVETVKKIPIRRPPPPPPPPSAPKFSNQKIPNTSEPSMLPSPKPNLPISPSSLSSSNKVNDAIAKFNQLVQAQASSPVSKK
jgi:hypothetical protein